MVGLLLHLYAYVAEGEEEPFVPERRWRRRRRLQEVCVMLILANVFLLVS